MVSTAAPSCPPEEQDREDRPPHRQRPEADALDAELDRQAGVLLAAGAPARAGLDLDRFSAAVEALRPLLRGSARGEPSPSRVPLVLVVAAGTAEHDAAASEALVPALRLRGSALPGVLDRNHGPEGLAPYRPIDAVGPAPSRVYALLDVDRGEEFRDVRPRDALPVVLGRGRTPLTIGEGLATVLAHPALLERNRCFMLSGSRRGDRRVPALWISGRAPKLGWCWDGNPHSWLGVASTAARVGVPV